MLYSLAPYFFIAILSVAYASNARLYEIQITDDELSPHVLGRVLVKVKPNAPFKALSAVEKKLGAKTVKTYSFVEGLRVFQFDPTIDVREAIKAFASNEAVIYAEPDYLYSIDEITEHDDESEPAPTDSTATLNDPEFPRQWSLENKGQTGGKPNADLNAELMWTHAVGSENLVVGIIDSGVDFTHPDIIANLWTNPGEIPGDNKDNDQNGFIDDIYGINAVRNNGVPMDDDKHGTHVAGTIGASANNSVGIVGVAQKVRLAACKFIRADGTGSISDAIECMQYFAALKTRATNPVNIIATNNSWGGGPRSQAMLDAITAHEKLGILFVVAAGNYKQDNDFIDSFPANYNVPNVISVAATDHHDRLATFSNYGKRSVHVAAPGVKILSTVLGKKLGELSGTSMAAPHVTGLAAVIASKFPSLPYNKIKNLILTGGEKTDAAAHTTISGRRIRGADTNGTGSLTCENQSLVVRQEPVATSHRVLLNKPFFFSATHINCADNGGPLTIYEGPAGSVILKDDGQHGDVAADDGIYSATWTPKIAGTFDFKFSDTDTITIQVYEKDKFQPYEAFDQVPYEYLTISGRRLRAGDDTMHIVESPFPIQFGGHLEGFNELFVSSNGTISFTERTQPGFTNRSLPTSIANTLVAPFWDDLVPDTSTSDIYVEEFGASPSRKFVVEWWRFKHRLSSDSSAFQVVFFENSPNLQFNYLDTNFNNENVDYGASATVGVQVRNDSSLEYEFNAPKVTSGKSIFFSLQ